jgi:tryptophan halogenase
MKKLKNLVIVGGGSSGWLSAAYLSYNFPKINITIIDKEIGTPVGVGEATLLNFRDFLKNCGFNLNEWYNELDATEKLGILFPNWIDDNKDISHPFFVQNFNKNSYVDWNLRIKKKYEDLSNVAYHVNCGKLTTFLQKKLNNKIIFKKSDVQKVVFDGDEIKKLILKNGEEITADLYVDCTGFKSILKNKTEKIILRDRLICDTAVACSVNYINENVEKLPYVRCEAVNEGWVWSIPVQSRIGSGFIFNREITPIENAKDFFIKYWNQRIKKENIKVIDWTPYYDKKIWSKNVVSIGLSAGFLEPLESTGLALAMEGIFQLSKRIYKNYYNEDDIILYNNIMKLFFENSIDFVNMHYLVSQRKGVFWEQARQLKKSEKFLIFEECIKNNKFDMDENNGFNDIDFFCSDNWYCWLTQSFDYK